MGRNTTTVRVSFDEEDFILDELRTELNKHGIVFDSIASFEENGELESFTSEFDKVLQHVNVSASVYNDPGRMYMSNGDPGYPEESGCEDIELEPVYFRGKKLDLNCINESALRRCEEALWDKFSEPDYDCPDRNYY
jgi:hypothetical protein